MNDNIINDKDSNVNDKDSNVNDKDSNVNDKDRNIKPILVYVPYNKGFITEVKKLRGRWNPEKGAWAVPAKFEKQLWDLLYIYYGLTP